MYFPDNFQVPLKSKIILKYSFINDWLLTASLNIELCLNDVESCKNFRLDLRTIKQVFRINKEVLLFFLSALNCNSTYIN